MKFLFVGTNPENTGGATHFVALAQAMAEAGHEVSVVAYPVGLIAQELAHSDVRLHGAAFRNALDLRGYAKVFAVTKQFRPDWLVGNFGKEYWPLIVIGRLLSVPVALFRHRTPPMRPLSAYLLPRLAQRFFAVSKNARNFYLERGVPAALVQVLYNPVSLARYRPDAQQRSAILRTLGISDDAIVLGYSGRMHGGKGIFTLFEAATAAMAQEPRLHCLWLGDGPEAEELRARAASHPMGSRHHFLGWIHDVHPYYSAMSMLAFPSIASETFGRVSIEAQAAGIPVLGSDVGGIPETLMPGVTGLLLPPGDVDAWRDAILAMCDASRRQAMGAAARDYVREHFSTSVIAAEFVRILANR
ncbi:glycosyltransferase family 4 protein [Dyella subtropica]|uniref:glycosyltransferase family 4 protein n=1 Tax=Dyella subtropica TaxID=2992127 RepID=UPI00224E14EA|nr:glycosyltransferase family 4 protein [Dyella subtropica]